MSEFSFKKHERLKSRKAIEQVFTAGKSHYYYPVRFLYAAETDCHDTRYPVKCGFSASKKNFRRAVDRNLIKRRMREAWRLHKSSLVETVNQKGLCLNVFLVYYGTEIEKYQVIEKAVKKGMGELARRC